VEKLKNLISQKNYDIFKGEDWPSYHDFIKNSYVISETVQKELEALINQFNPISNKEKFSKEYAIENAIIESFSIEQNGEIAICAKDGKTQVIVGNLFNDKNILEILNSEYALECRENKISSMPSIIIFNFDLTCNYKCKTCRNELINWNKNKKIRNTNDKLVNIIKQKIFDEIKKQSVTIKWAGGEPFVSEVYLELLEYIIEKNNFNIQNIIQTNGSTFKMPKSTVEDLLPFVKELRISFDAALEETYNMIRFNNEWQNVNRNALYINQLIEKNNFKTKLIANFLVQQDNFKEIPAFIKLCDNLGINNINLQKLSNWGTFTKLDFYQTDVQNPTHPCHEEVKEFYKLLGYENIE
jgi:MoaA/NifB/PqqE/SkfB family radical SAM enzyme